MDAGDELSGDGATAIEIHRLESNHTELLLHQETLREQLYARQEQLRLIRAAIRDCQALETEQEQELEQAPELGSGSREFHSDKQTSELSASRSRQQHQEGDAGETGGDRTQKEEEDSDVIMTEA